MSEKANLHGNIDKRARRSRERLSEALLSLGAERPLEGLSVGSLAAGAGVSRATFYKHFASKDDFLVRSWVNLLQRTEEIETARDPDRSAVIPSGQIFSHVAQRPEYVRSLVRSETYLRLMAEGEAKLREIAEANLQRRRPRWSKDRRAETATYVAAGFVGLLRWWMQSGLRRSPETLQAAFARLTAQALAD